MNFMGRCCNKCTHSLNNPCQDYISCRTEGPLCHSSEDCSVKMAAMLDFAIHGGKELRINVGMGTCGLVAGAQYVFDVLIDEIKSRKLKAKLVRVGCIGACYAEPTIEITGKDYPGVIYGHVTPQKAVGILDAYLSGDVSDAFALRSKSGKMRGENKVPLLDELPFLRYQVRDAIQNCGIIDPESIEEYITYGGYIALTRVLKEMTPEEVIDEISASGLRGRGGAGFPTGLKWKFCRQAKGDKKYVICNADEGDPGAFMNRLNAEGDPHRVLEGLIIAAYAIGADEGYVFVRAEKPLMAERLATAAKQAEQRGLLGEKILDSNFSLNVNVMLSAGAFVCGEETGMIAAIEGRRAMPRPRPPFPATKGLWDKPTTINNVETLAHVPTIIVKGAEEFSKVGSERSKGTKVYCLTGKIKRTGAAEVPLGTTMSQLIFDIGGGPPDGKKFKAVQTGGPSGGCLSEEFLDLPLDYEALQSAGSIMGSGGIVVLDEDTCIVDLARYFLTFTTAESCGECAPCRIGLKQMFDTLTEITNGEGKEEDLELLQTLGRTVAETSLCALGRTAPNPVLTTLKYFREEYEAHIKERRCPAHVCQNFIKEYQVNPEVCRGCGLCVKECSSRAITLKDVYDSDTQIFLPKNAVIDDERCVRCGQCFLACPTNAIEKVW